MSLLDDARRLNDGPYPTDDQGYCSICGGTNLLEDHKPDCLWLSMPKIVAALEVAQQILALSDNWVGSPDVETATETFMDGLLVQVLKLRLLLRGEEIKA